MRKEFTKAFGANIRHRVDIDNRVVVCKIRPSKDIFRLLNRFGRITPNDFSTAKSGGEYKGVAKCSFKDDFDGEYGKKIATAKANIKYHKALIADLKKVRDKFLKSRLEAINSELEREIEKLDRCQSHLKRLVNENNE